MGKGYKERTDELPPRKMTKVEDFLKPTFEKFFTSEELAEIARKAQTVAVWDFNVALGDTIKEKYESLSVKCHEVTAILLRNGAKGYFWICCSPEVASIFEVANYGFWPAPFNDKEDKSLGVSPLGLSELKFRGTINNKWRLYADTEMPEDTILIGCNDKMEDSSHYARLKVVNFVI